MYHGFSRATGKLVSTLSLQAVRPVLQKSVPAVTYDPSVKLSPVSVRSQSTKLIEGTDIPCSPLDPAIKAKQELFQKDDDVPIHLKGGPMDQVLYRLTFGLIFIGLGGLGWDFFHMIQN